MSKITWDIHYRSYPTQLKTSSEGPDIGDSVWLSEQNESYCYLVDITERTQEDFVGKIITVIPGVLFERGHGDSATLSEKLENQGETIRFGIHHIQDE
ncbi:hypothetical protein [Dongshaea marina]|uniref:hypothetical protein n=1 Tax=Dongshaea marina TaxID=2047966 RepID=UPI000D3E9889|nr:hypothetical protein [Dongshaea marina]